MREGGRRHARGREQACERAGGCTWLEMRRTGAISPRAAWPVAEPNLERRVPRVEEERRLFATLAASCGGHEVVVVGRWW